MEKMKYIRIGLTASAIGRASADWTIWEWPVCLIYQCDMALAGSGWARPTVWCHSMGWANTLSITRPISMTYPILNTYLMYKPGCVCICMTGRRSMVALVA